MRAVFSRLSRWTHFLISCESSLLHLRPRHSRPRFPAMRGARDETVSAGKRVNNSLSPLRAAATMRVMRIAISKLSTQRESEVISTRLNGIIHNSINLTFCIQYFKEPAFKIRVCKDMRDFRKLQVLRHQAAYRHHEYTVGAAVGVLPPRENHHQIRFANGNLVLALVVLAHQTSDFQ